MKNINDKEILNTKGQIYNLATLASVLSVRKINESKMQGLKLHQKLTLPLLMMQAKRRFHSTQPQNHVKQQLPITAEVTDAKSHGGSAVLTVKNTAPMGRE